MLPNHIGVHIAGIDREILPEQVPQPGGVQRGAAAQHPTGVEAGQRTGNPGHDIHRIGGYQKDAVKAGFGYRTDNGTENRGVSLQKIQPGFPRFLRDPGADDHDIRVRAVGVFPGVDFHAGGGKGQPVVQIHRLSPGPLPVQVDQNKLVAGVLVQQRVSVAHPHHAGADQHYLPVVAGSHNGVILSQMTK